MLYAGFSLDPFQEQAIAALDAGRSVLVCAPTGTGKTVIADWTVERALARGREVVYTAPIKALSNQKFRDWTRTHGEAKVGLLTGDLVIRRDAPCRVMTTEILRNMLLQGERLEHLDAVIVDEIHFLDDRERGTTWEELLIYLPREVQVLGLSATLSNAGAFASWMGSVRGAPVEVVRQDQRAVPLRFWVGSVGTGLQEPRAFDRAQQGGHKAPAHRGRRERHGHGHGRRGGRDSVSTTHTDIFEMLLERDLLPCLYFAFSRKATEQYARGLAARLSRDRRRPVTLLDEDEAGRVRARLDALAAEDPQLLDAELRGLYELGIGFHHAGVHVKLKQLVEELYEARLIKMLYCTSTFALGINMPARTAAFDALRKYDGRSLRPLTTREFMQKAGRAGRRGMDDVGHVVVRMDPEDWELARGHLQELLRGEPEPVHSSFSLSFHSIVNLLSQHPLTRVEEIVDHSFLNWAARGEALRHTREADRIERLLESGEAPKGASKERERLLARASKAEGRCRAELQAKLGFLKEVGYLDDDLSFNAGAKVLQNVQIEEIFVTELVLAGLFEGLPPDLTFGLLCAVNKEFGRGVTPRERLRGDGLRLAKEANRIRHSPTVQRAEQLSGIEVTWCPEMIPYGALWARGQPFAALMLSIDSPTDTSGDLVGAFRRAKDLIGQLKLVYADDEGKREELAKLLQDVSRDEVLVVD